MKLHWRHKSFRKIGLGAEQRGTFQMDIPTMIRLLEWARETARSDEELHRLAEKLQLLPSRVITMDDYAFLLQKGSGY